MNYKFYFFSIILLTGIFVSTAYGEIIGPPEGVLRDTISGVKFLDAYFGDSSEKIEVGPGDKNVPLTLVFANIGNNDLV